MQRCLRTTQLSAAARSVSAGMELSFSSYLCVCSSAGLPGLRLERQCNISQNNCCAGQRGGGDSCISKGCLSFCVVNERKTQPPQKKPWHRATFARVKRCKLSPDWTWSSIFVSLLLSRWFWFVLCFPIICFHVCVPIHRSGVWKKYKYAFVYSWSRSLFRREI